MKTKKQLKPPMEQATELEPPGQLETQMESEEPPDKVYARKGRGDRKKTRLSLLATMYFDIERLRVMQQVRQSHLRLDHSVLADDPIFESTANWLVHAQTDIDTILAPMVLTHPCWTEFNLHVKGVGPHLLALVMGLIRDITPFTTVSKLWWLCGLAVKDGHALRRVKGEVMTYDQRLKSVLLGRVGGQLLRNGDPFAVSLYNKYYPEEETKQREKGIKQKLQPAVKDKTGKIKKEAYRFYPGTHMRALRKVTKLWVACLWVTWRQAEGLPITEPYAMRVLGHDDHNMVTPERWVAYNKSFVKQ